MSLSVNTRFAIFLQTQIGLHIFTTVCSFIYLFLPWPTLNTIVNLFQGPAILLFWAFPRFGRHHNLCCVPPDQEEAAGCGRVPRGSEGGVHSTRHRLQ